MKRHVREISKTPATAQVNNLQIKLDSTTAMIDNLLLVYRQQPWKATGYSGNGSSSGSNSSTNTNTEI